MSTNTAMSPSLLQQLPAELRLQIYQSLGFHTHLDVHRNTHHLKSLDIRHYRVLTYGHGPCKRLLPPASMAPKDRNGVPKGNIFAAEYGFIDRGALSLLRSNRFFFSELCPLLYKRVVFLASFDNVLLLDLAGKSSKLQQWPQSQLEYHPHCSPSHVLALQNIPHVHLQLPSWNLFDCRPNDVRYLTNTLMVLRRSLVRLCSLLPNLRELCVTFPWDRLDMIAMPVRRNFFKSFSHIIRICPRLQSLLFLDWDLHSLMSIWFGFLNQEQRSQLDKQQLEQGKVDEARIKKDGVSRPEQISKCLMDTFSVRLWEWKSKKDYKNKSKKMEQIFRNAPFYTNIKFIASERPPS